jgi:Flp pilus assembly protein TadD
MVDVVRREAQATVLGPDNEYPVYECALGTNELVRAGKLAEATKELADAIARHPDEPKLMAMRGRLFVCQGQWKEAAADYMQLVEFDPTDVDGWWKIAPLLVLAGDLEGYHKHCQDLLAEFGTSEEANVAEIVSKACLLVPGTAETPELSLKTLEKTLDDGSAPRYLYKRLHATQALAAYRAGDAEKAVHWVRKTQESDGYADAPRIQAIALSLLALGQRQLGQPDEATEALAQADALIDEYLPKLASGELDSRWHDWLIAKILCREAAASVAEPATQTTPKEKAKPNPETE